MSGSRAFIPGEKSQKKDAIMSLAALLQKKEAFMYHGIYRISHMRYSVNAGSVKL